MREAGASLDESGERVMDVYLRCPEKALLRCPEKALRNNTAARRLKRLD